MFPAVLIGGEMKITFKIINPKLASSGPRRQMRANRGKGEEMMEERRRTSGQVARFRAAGEVDFPNLM